jgi:hypothetical protein
VTLKKRGWKNTLCLALPGSSIKTSHGFAGCTEPDVILQEIIDDLESALAQLRGISEDLTQEPS